MLSFTAGRSPRREDQNGRLDGRFDDGIDDLTYSKVELAGKYLLPRRRWMGSGGRRWHKCVELDEGHAPLLLLENLLKFQFWVVMIVIFHCRTISLLRGSKRAFVEQFDAALMTLPTTELSLQTNICCPDLFSGDLESGNDLNA